MPPSIGSSADAAPPDSSTFAASITQVSLSLLPIRHAAGRFEDEAKICYALGVMYFQLSRWEQSERWLRASYELYTRLMETRSEYRVWAGESLRRLIELSLRKGAHDEGARYLDEAASILSTNDQIARNAVYSDVLLADRFKHTVTRWYVNDCLYRAWQGITDMTSVFNRLSNTLYDLMKVYEDVRAYNLVDEVRLDYCRHIAPAKRELSLKMLEASPDLQRGRQCDAGPSLVELTTLKIKLCETETMSARQIWRICEHVQRLAHRFLHRYHSPFWRADALCVSLAAAMQAGARNTSTLADLAFASTSRLGRTDKAEIAEGVGRGAPSIMLLAE